MGLYNAHTSAGCRNVKLQSQQHLNVNFNPASLLSVGDALAFAYLLIGGDPATPLAPSENGSVSDFLTSSPEAAPELQEQMVSHLACCWCNSTTQVIPLLSGCSQWAAHMQGMAAGRPLTQPPAPVAVALTGGAHSPLPAHAQWHSWQGWNRHCACVHAPGMRPHGPPPQLGAEQRQLCRLRRGPSPPACPRST